MAYFDDFNFNPFSASQSQGQSANPWEANQFPQYDPGSLGGQQQFPTDDFRMSSFASMMNPMHNFMDQMPATQAYMSQLGNVPRYQDYRPGIGRGIGAALAGLAASFNSPQAGAAVASSIAGAPYMRALQDFQIRTGAMGQAAGAEQALAKQGLEFGKSAGQQALGMGELGLKQQGLGLEERKITQAGELGEKEIGLKTKVLENSIAQASLDRALQEKKISVEQYNSATQRLNAETAQQEGVSRSDYWKSLIGVKEHPPEKPTTNPELIGQQVFSELSSNPLTSKYVSSSGRVNMKGGIFSSGLQDDPQALEVYKQIRKKYGQMK